MVFLVVFVKLLLYRFCQFIIVLPIRLTASWVPLVVEPSSFKWIILPSFISLIFFLASSVLDPPSVWLPIPLFTLFSFTVNPIAVPIPSAILLIISFKVFQIPGNLAISTNKPAVIRPFLLKILSQLKKWLLLCSFPSPILSLIAPNNPLYSLSFSPSFSASFFFCWDSKEPLFLAFTKSAALSASIIASFLAELSLISSTSDVSAFSLIKLPSSS